MQRQQLAGGDALGCHWVIEYREYPSGARTTMLVMSRGTKRVSGGFGGPALIASPVEVVTGSDSGWPSSVPIAAASDIARIQVTTKSAQSEQGIPLSDVHPETGARYGAHLLPDGVDLIGVSFWREDGTGRDARLPSLPLPRPARRSAGWIETSRTER